MAIETTELAIPSVDTVRRESYLAALSLAQQLVNETAALPADFTITVDKWAPLSPEVRFYFHRDEPALRQFRDDQMLTETRTTREDGGIYIEAVRENVRGVRLVAWTLLSAGEAAQVTA